MATICEKCPSCGSSQGYHVYECKKCGARYCAKCDGSGGGYYCPVCKSESQTIVGDIIH